MKAINENLVEDLIGLRDELVPRAFEEHCDTPSRVKNAELAEVFFKINSCLYRGLSSANSLIITCLLCKLCYTNGGKKPEEPRNPMWSI